MTNAAVNEDEDDVATCCTTVLAAPAVPPRAQRGHDVKNCLSVILAITWLIERDTSAQVCERVKRLRASAEQLRELVMTTDLTESSALRAAAGVAFPAHVLAQAVVERAREQATRAEVRLQLVSAPGELVGDEPALREALFNLVTNAIDATPPGGTVVVSSRETGHGDHQWEVRDSGCGIAPEQMPALGRAFRTTKAGGSGVGLAVVQATVTAHGGLLRIESRKGGGSTFTVLLPSR